jgi:release factor glutamine methyltransferase
MSGRMCAESSPALLLRRDALELAAQKLGSRQSAQWLVSSLVEKEGDSHSPLSDAEREALFAALGRLEAGEPLQYVLSSWEFYGIELRCDPRALIVRPETEILVEEAQRVVSRFLSTRPLRLLDLGTGTGAIALALGVLLHERETVEILGIDRSNDALSLANENREFVATNYRTAQITHRVNFAYGEWFNTLSPTTQRRFDLIVSNPPYVGESEYDSLSPQLYFEPRSALVAEDFDEVVGFSDVAAIIADARRWLAPDGVLLVEMAPHQCEAAVERAQRCGFAHAYIVKDLAMRTRVVVAHG